MKYRKGQSTWMSSVLGKIILALILIVLLTLFLVSLWKSVFPDEDKTAISYFSLLYDFMNKNLKSTKPYDSNTLPSFYLPKDYMIYFFDGPQLICDPHIRDSANIIAGFSPSGPQTSTSIVLKPSSCEEGKICMCIFDTEALNAKKDANVVLCKSFDKRFALKAYELMDGSCTRKEGKFFKIIVGVETTSTQKNAYILLYNDQNKNFDADMHRKLCPNKDSTDICYTKKHEDIVIDPILVLNACQKEKAASKTIAAQCQYDPQKDSCILNCDTYAIDCSQIRTCNDYVSTMGDGGKPGVYLLKNSPGYAYCENDKTICNSNNNAGCIIEDKKQYRCKTEEALKTTCEELVALPVWTKDCEIETRTQGYTKIITIKENSAACKEIINDYLDPIYGCAAPAASTP